MRKTDPRHAPDAFAGDGWVAGPIIIVPPGKDAPLVASAPGERPRRERLARAGFALGGAAVTLALTLVGAALQNRTEPEAPRSTARPDASTPVTAREVPRPAIAPSRAVPAEVLVAGVLVMAALPLSSPSMSEPPSGATELGPSDVELAGPVLATPVVLLSSTLALRPGSASVTGTWYHVDARAQNADSLVLALLADGTARSFERRWSIGDRGWHAETTERRGRWMEDEPDRANREICVAWSSPDPIEACAQFFSDRGETRMSFGGRYWQRAACVEQPQEAESVGQVGSIAGRSSTPGGTTN